MEDIIWDVLLRNAYKYKKAKPEVAIGPVIKAYPEKKQSISEIIQKAKKIAEQINMMSEEEISDRIKKIGLPEKETKDPFKIDHPNPVLRFEPSPSGPMHIGHTFPLGLNHLLAVNNNGKLILRISDTNPDNIYPPAYEMLVEDANYLTHNGIDQVIIQSDRMEIYYYYAEEMLSKGWAYICTCEVEVKRNLLRQKKACECRDKPPAIQLERWELMKTTWEPGDAVMRIKTDLEHKNPAIRDWPAMRINTSEHPRQKHKYRVWPLMNFSVSVDDIEGGLTHILRAKDHADNAKRQEYIYKYFNKPLPVVYNVGKINFTDLKLSTSQVRKQIDEGVFSGWDDIRLPFLVALRRRGFQSEAFLRMAKEIGISKADKKLTKEEFFTAVEAYNREIIEPQADRLFFVRNPVKISVVGMPEKTITRDKHPDYRKGGRTFNLKRDLYVEENDLQVNAEIYRLIDAANFRKEGDEIVYVDDDLDTYKGAVKKHMLHYLPVEESLNAELHMPDGSIIKGVVEKEVLNYEKGKLFQLERIGYVRLDNKEPIIFWYAHK